MNAPDNPESTLGTSRVDVTCIQHYARNPRRQQNPEYDRIKASIRAEGMDQPLVLVQEPGDTDYVLHSGGNTRLRIIRELFEETGDERYRWVDCVIKPWSQESNVLFAHLRENELRSGLPFIDKALAVFDAKSLLEEELAIKTLSLRQLEALFRGRGLGFSFSLIGKMGYAVGTLWPVMPKALSAGLGRQLVEKIRTLERAARGIWRRRELGEDTEFDAVFAELCRRHDSAEWDIQPLRDALENEIAVEAEQNHQVIHLAMEAQLAGRPFDFTNYSDEDIEEEQAGNSVTAGQPDESRSTGTTTSNDPSMGRDSSASNNHDPDCHREPESTTPVPDYHQNTGIPEMPLTTGNPQDLNSLRTQLWDCAAPLAEHHGLGETVIQLPDQGLGVLVVDVPPQELTDSLDTEMLALVAALWWQLAASSELTMAPLDIVLHYMNEASPLHKALASHDSALLFGSIWTTDPAHMGGLLWQQLSQPDWQALLQMMATYRAIKQLAFESGIKLWVSGKDTGHADQ